MKLTLAAVLLVFAIPAFGQTATDKEAPPTTVRFSAVCEDNYPESKPMVMKGRTATETLTVLNDPIITEKDILKAKVVTENNASNIVITLKPSGQTKLNDGVAEMMDKRLAIIVNDTLVSAPVLRSVKFGPMVQISGNFTEEQANKIARDLSHN